MSHRPSLDSALRGRTVAVPESRQLDILADLFERRRARVLRVPLVAIHDAPDQGPISAWLEAFIARPPDLFIILTGEGLRRLHAAAARQKREVEFGAALGGVATLCRGPKPGRALKEMGLQPQHLAQAPTTAGVIATLDGMDLVGKRVAVQLYGEDPNPALMNYLGGQGLAECLPVAPYVYSDDAETTRVVTLIASLAAAEIDMLAFTSKPQVKRLFAVARQHDLEQALRQGLAVTLIAAVGPVVRDELLRHGCRVAVMPESSYFMKPMVSAAEAAFAAQD